MALSSCPECDGKVSSTAKTCPHCGHNLTFGRKGLEAAKDTAGSIWNWFWIILIFGLIFGLISKCSQALF